MQLYIYWLGDADLAPARKTLTGLGLKVREVKLAACQTLKAHGDTVLLAPPAIFNGLCGRQGAWYRGSHRAGQTLLVSAAPLTGGLEAFLDAVVGESDFAPARLPGEAEVAALSQAAEYQAAKPADWELIGLKDAVIQKLFFTATGVWKRGDNLKKHWPTQCASHANFLSRRYTAERDGEDVAYSVSDTAGICSSCVETFNLVSDDARKLVAPCPGAVRFGGAKRDVYLDVQPVRPGPVQGGL